jgi:hypothetical protein
MRPGPHDFKLRRYRFLICIYSEGFDMGDNAAAASPFFSVWVSVSC